MATPSGGKETDARGLADRISGAVSGMWNGWFGPGQPLNPIAPSYEVAGRRFDFPYGVNLSYAPRQEQGEFAVPFSVLRAVADPSRGGLDLLRLAIEKRKSQLATIQWKIQARGGENDGGQRARDIEGYLRKPDGYNTFRVFQRTLLEDHFVIDAVCAYPRAHPDYTRIEPMDGATIKLVIDEFGRVPVPPAPRYQQFLKGVPATDYDFTELRYYASNQRTDHIYGYSRVEQVIGMVTIALNRQLSIGSYYTKGSIPEMLLEMPPGLTSKTQLAEFNEYWQSLLSGNVTDRWMARMIPAGAKPHFSKDEVLKDAFDEWLARIICFAFDLPPTSLVKETNRSVSDNQKQTAEQEGLLTTKGDFKDWMDDIIALDFDGEDLEFAWDEEEIIDPKVNADIVVALYGGTTGQSKQIITLDEAREKLGYDPATDDQREELTPPEPPPMVPGSVPGDEPKLDENGKPIAADPPAKKTPGQNPPPADAAKAQKARAGRLLPGSETRTT